MKQCPYPDCAWQAIAPSTEGARQAYMTHVVDEHLLATDAISVDPFEAPPGHTSDPRSHDTAQVVIVFEGELVLHTEDASVELSTSDSMRIDAGESHYSENPGDRPCVGLRVSTPGPEFSGGIPG
ncbi:MULTISPECIES: cupin domain-containing protein [Salinibaculum]|uniref:cupin domain-containing protein n=1 Tax=Salinibaculum TaxID=2732368 RepID=UPI0030CDA989